MRRSATIGIGAGLAAIAFAAGDAEPPSSLLDEASCILDGLPATARLAIVEAMATSDRAERQERVQAAFKENAVVVRAAGQSCVARFAWSLQQQDSAIRAVEFGLRLEASVIRLQANGLTEQAASEVFEGLPAIMHEAIFGKRRMTSEETRLLQSAFEKLVRQLDGPDGDALSEYVTARAGYLYYARELASH